MRVTKKLFFTPLDSIYDVLFFTQVKKHFLHRCTRIIVPTKITVTFNKYKHLPILGKHLFILDYSALYIRFYFYRYKIYLLSTEFVL